MAWHSEDKEWIKTRKKEWLELKKNSLDIDTWFKQKDLKQVRHYFLTGEEDPDNPLPDFSHGKNLSKYPVPLFIKLWFYPEPSVELFRKWIKEAKSRDLKDCFYSIGNMNWQGFNTDYGMMGGREELIIKALFGESFDEYKQLYFEFTGKHKTDTSYANNVSIGDGIARWLLCGYPVYCAPQFRIDHWWQSLPYKNDLDDERYQGTLIFTMYQVAFFKDPFDLPPEESRYYKVAEKLKDIFENKPLPPVVKELWEKVKNKEIEVPEWYR